MALSVISLMMAVMCVASYHAVAADDCSDMVSLQLRVILENAVDEKFVRSSTCASNTPASSLPLGDVQGLPAGVSGEARCFLYCRSMHGCVGFNYLSQATADGTQCQPYTSAPGTFIQSANCHYYKTKDNSDIHFAKPRDCADIFASGSTSNGVYTVYVSSLQRPVSVYCDMTTDGGGWTVFQRRQDGIVDFYRVWVDYAAGFGDVSKEFWLGNDNLYALVGGQRQYELRIDLADFSGGQRYAKYDNFKVTSAYTKYKLTSIGAYVGTAGDSLTAHVGNSFTTYDQDNDANTAANCAVLYKGAWWYNTGHHSNLNGHYYRGTHTSHADGVNWYHWKGYTYSLQFTEMKFRPTPA